MPDQLTAPAVDPADFDWSDETGPAADVRRIAAAADAVDHVVNLNEAAVLHLKNRGLSGATLHLTDHGFALRYDETLDLVVHPDARGAGLGTALATAALAGTTGEVTAWSHPDHPGAARLAARLGLARERELLVMERRLDDTLPGPTAPGDYRVRSFRPGDEEGLLHANALAFAQHPEQGHMSLQDLQERLSEPWFDPAGLFLAVPEDDSEDDPDRQVLGIHWTKVHPEGYGEVYVVAVNPKAAGRGIGSVLTEVGLHHLRDLGLPSVLLYVDGDNDPAIAVYTAAGFVHTRTEAQYVTHQYVGRPTVEPEGSAAP